MIRFAPMVTIRSAGRLTGAVAILNAVGDVISLVETVRNTQAELEAFVQEIQARQDKTERLAAYLREFGPEMSDAVLNKVLRAFAGAG